MNILERPDLMDRLAAGYALGTLRGGARRRFETLARSSPRLRVTAQVWQERFMSITEVQQSLVPHPNVWKRIENLVAADVAAAPPVVGTTKLQAELLQRARNWWRAGALAAMAVSLAAVVVTLNVNNRLHGSEQQLAQLQAQGRELV